MTDYGPEEYNVDINQPGASQYPRYSIIRRAPYKDAIVEDIILNRDHPDYAPNGSNIGMVRVRIIPDNRGTPTDRLNWATPLESSIREYPLKNEIVMIFYSVGKLFYTRRVNITNKITESSWPGLAARFSPRPSAKTATQDVVLAASGGPPVSLGTNDSSITLGDEFKENPAVKMVQPFEGDTIIQSRYGSVVRFGSSLFSNAVTNNPSPNILLTAGQAISKVTTVPGAFGLTYEDINLDRTAIWMVTNEEITLLPATAGSVAHLRSAEISDSDKYTGAQIFANSDRIILNSKLNEISLFSNAEINLSAVQSITIDSAKSVMITGERDITLTTPQDIVLTGRTISLNSTKDFSQETSGNYIISGKKIFIGASPNDTTQPMVLGGQLSLFLKDVISILQDITISFVPSPNAAATLTRLGITLAKLTTDISFGKGASFNSTSNFTSKTND